MNLSERGADGLLQLLLLFSKVAALGIFAALVQVQEFKGFSERVLDRFTFVTLKKRIESLDLFLGKY